MTSDEKKYQFTTGLVSGYSIPHLIKTLGIPKATAYKWEKQFRKDGDTWFQMNRRTKYAFSRNESVTWDVDRLIRTVALDHPEWGCDRIAEMLANFAVPVSSPTIQKILIEQDLGTVSKRYAHLNKLAAVTVVDELALVPLSEAQQRFVDRQRQMQRQQIIPGTRPGERLVQDICWRNTKNHKRLYYAHIVVDTFDNRIFCSVRETADEQTAIEMIDEVYHAYKSNGTAIGTVLTNRSRCYTGVLPSSKYRLYLKEHRINHRVFGRQHGVPRRPAIVVNAWKKIRTEFMRGEDFSVLYGEMQLDELDHLLSEWLKSTYIKKL